jgi:hypothetical protein
MIASVEKNFKRRCFSNPHCNAQAEKGAKAPFSSGYRLNKVN